MMTKDKLIVSATVGSFIIALILLIDHNKTPAQQNSTASALPSNANAPYVDSGSLLYPSQSVNFVAGSSSVNSDRTLIPMFGFVGFAGQ